MTFTHTHLSRCSLCDIWPSTSWVIHFAVRRAGGIRFEKDARHVCEGCARSNRHLAPISCDCAVRPEKIQWHRTTWKGPGGITCQRCFRPARTLWWHRDYCVYDPVVEKVYVLQQVCAACRREEEGRAP